VVGKMSDDGGGKSGGGARVGEKPGKSRPSEAPKPVVDKLPGGSGGDAARKSEEEERKIEATQSHGRWVDIDDHGSPPCRDIRLCTRLSPSAYPPCCIAGHLH
jgi:hypothetical protein